MQEDAIRMIDVQMAYGQRVVLENITFSIARGEVLAIIGPSGSGKSTILRMLIGLIRPTAGEILIDGKKVENFDENQWNTVRKKMGMVFQYSALFDSMTVGENVAFGLKRRTSKGPGEIREAVDKMLDIVGLSGYADYMPNELSGGMKKRVSLARAVAPQPDILLYDEPTAGLDPVMSDVINSLMVETKKRLNITSVLVTHDMDSAFMVADKVIMIDQGTIIARGTPAEILKNEHPVVKKFVRRVAEDLCIIPKGSGTDE